MNPTVILEHLLLWILLGGASLVNCATLVAGKAQKAWRNTTPHLMVLLEHLRLGGVGLVRCLAFLANRHRGVSVRLS